ncbi:MAG: sigma-70 family RNA polymerase sigma factor [Flavobacteriales bacterium]
MSTEQIWREYSDHVLRYFQSKVHDKDVAEDLRQEVFLKVHQHLNSLKDQQKVDHWLRVVTRNAVVDYWKSKGKHIDEPSLQLERDTQFDHLANQCVNRMITTLPDKYAEPLRLSDIEGIKQEDIADQLGLSYSATKSRIQRGRVMLKEALTACCKVQVNVRNELVDADCQGDCHPKN